VLLPDRRENVGRGDDGRLRNKIAWCVGVAGRAGGHVLVWTFRAHVTQD
jgi:hypothetical protein